MTRPDFKLPDLQAPASFGFLNVVELPSLGFCGGLLIVSQIGRPVEFHCTAPVPANRAQEIMYGQTYTSFLFSDQIGAALIERVKAVPDLYLTQCPDMLPITEWLDQPVLLAQPETTNSSFDGSGLHQFEVNSLPVWCLNTSSDQQGLVQHHVQRFGRQLPLDEPFERIAQAIEEAHAVLRAA